MERVIGTGEGSCRVLKLLSSMRPGAICGNSRMKLIAHILMLGMAAALSSHAFGQTAEQPRPAERDKSLAVAPQAAPAADPRPSGNEARDTAAGPANICRRLVTFLEPKPAQPPAAAGQPGPNPAASAAGPSVPGSGQPAPVPQAPAAAAPPAGGYDEANALAKANDVEGCQKAAQQLRRAGLALPPGLIALAALKPELLGASKQ